MKDEKNVFALGKIPSNKQKAAAGAPAPKLAPEATPAMEREFVEAARTHSVPVPRQALEWQSLDPEQQPTRGINVRFNEYELGLLRYLAERQDRSVHKIIKRLLIPAAHELLAEVNSLQESDSHRPRSSGRSDDT